MHRHLYLRQVAEFIGIAFLLTVRPTVGLKAPLPQVTAEVLLLERSRLELEEAMSIFNNPDILQGAIRGAMLPRVGEETTGGGAAARFQQMNDRSVIV
ncbi:hypothetical protein EAH_00037400 [Eimeria acervulina]|uniref:Uncharacterized protein n=1 Tax=Eimeria acervulina TaxID=5801 RepID=U6GF08_EIMAC|nr:hypothetical protein EAH_00037400 [Eimeria acervulina]CDI78841.1 hypothetical protein EAH_00037400 [Eimeria acervulina]